MSKSIITSHQPSMTEWFAAIGEINESNAFREEDNRKSDRLENLYKTTGLTYERPIKFSARNLVDKTPAFQKILKSRGNKHCAIRLVPKKQHLPKLRNRGMLLIDCYNDWFLKQDINPDNYDAYILPHSPKVLWSASFIVAKDMIFGEMIRGIHAQLTHGDTKNTLYQFRYNFKEWQWSNKNRNAEKTIRKMINMLYVSDSAKRKKLGKLIKSRFSHNYLLGYFEALIWPDKNIYFIDYNRLLPDYIKTPPFLLKKEKNQKNIISGNPVFPGVIKNKVVKINPEKITKVKFGKNSILVCDNTDIRFLPLMKKASAIITNRGGILSHTAIISRELKKPCIVGTKIATRVLKDGDIVEVDANKGLVRILKNN